MIGELFSLGIWKIVAVICLFVLAILIPFSSYQYIKINNLESRNALLERKIELCNENLVKVYLGASGQADGLKDYTSKIYEICRELIKGMEEEEEK